MEAIYIPNLTKAPQQTMVLEVQEFLPGLETLTPIRGRFQVQHQGNYLNVSAQVETIITLACHRCLQHYNYRLSIAPTEIIWLDAATEQPDDLPLEREVAIEDLVETVSGQGYFYPNEWLYEQLCLEIPQRQLCDAQCVGIQITSNQTETPVDRRWSSLEALKNQLPN